MNLDEADRIEVGRLVNSTIREAMKVWPPKVGVKEISTTHIQVYREVGSHGMVYFAVNFMIERDPLRIKIIPAFRCGPGKPLCITWKTNESPECRYQIDGHGSYQRREIVNRALRDVGRLVHE